MAGERDSAAAAVKVAFELNEAAGLGVLTSVFPALGVALMGSYLPSGTARVPEDDPSTNSTGGGRSLLNDSISLEYLTPSSDCGANGAGEA